MFRIYKPGQGKYTRLCTGFGGGLLTVIAAHEIYKRLDVTDNIYVQIFVPLGILIGVGLLIFWIVNKQNAADFMIATEGEMKKVSWSSKQEIVGSTKVVIITTIFLAVLLFVVDLGFMWFFKQIGVLKF